MNRRILLILFFFSLSACATHHYRIDGNEMTLIFRNPDAKNVVLFCSLDGFMPRTVKKKWGNWELELPAGETFRYFYRVDDVPYLPDCPMKEKDDFGSENCIFDPHL